MTRQDHQQRWAIVATGGERLLGGRREGRSLLEQTLDRTRYFATPRQTVVSVCREHLKWRHLWEGPDGPRSSIQPHDVGTGPATLLATMLIQLQCPDATVALFPAYQYASNKRRLMRPVHEAAAWVEQHPEDLVALGVRPTRPASEYGWLLPHGDDPTAELAQAQLFDQPRLELARWLLERGALWNTSVLIYRASTLMRLMELLAPEWWVPLFAARVVRDDVLDALYDTLPPFSLSKDILEKCSGHLRMLPLRGLTWCDVGTTGRIATIDC